MKRVLTAVIFFLVLCALQFAASLVKLVVHGVDEKFLVSTMSHVAGQMGFLFPAIAASRKISSFTADSCGDEGDLRPCHPVVNRILRTIFAAERFWLELLPLPFGVSYLAVLKKNSAGGT